MKDLIILDVMPQFRELKTTGNIHASCYSSWDFSYFVIYTLINVFPWWPMQVHLTSREANASHKPNHELQLKNYKKPYTYDGCKMPAFGLIYRCERGDFYLHTHCTFPKRTAKHEFFRKSTFEFLDKLPGKCHCRDCQR